MRSQFLKLPVLLLLITGLFAGLAFLLRPAPKAPETLLSASLQPAYGPANYGEALEQVERDLTLANERIARAPQQWLGYEGLALGHLIKAQLTGSFADMNAARQWIDTGLNLAPEGGGPAIAASTINLSLHRYPAALEQIEAYGKFAVKQGTAERAEMLAQAGDVAFYSGDYDAALAQYNQAYAIDPSPNSTFRLATWHKYLGEFDTAITLYKNGALSGRQTTPELLAAYHLQIGALELQRGNWDEAAAYFDRADELFPGYWLTQAHQAQMLAATGNRKRAKQMYRAILQDNENPDVMMALASVLEFEGEDASAKTWRAKAASLFEERMKALPEAYYDHGLDLAITDGNSALALDLAKANDRARPFGDAKIALARAHIANGEAAEALTILEQVEASGWQSVEQYAALAEAHAMLGNAAESEKYEDLALNRNPKAMTAEADMLAFGSH